MSPCPDHPQWIHDREDCPFCTRLPPAAPADPALLDVLADVIDQACGSDDGTVDSGALSAYAEGIRALAAGGRVTIDVDIGRRVIARWTEPRQ